MTAPSSASSRPGKSSSWTPFSTAPKNPGSPDRGEPARTLSLLRLPDSVPPRGAPGGLLERVLDLLAGLRHVALRLVGFALSTQAVVAGRLSSHLLHLSLGALCGVLCL